MARDESGKLSETERQRLLAIVEKIAKRPSTRPQSEVIAELKELRRARKHGGRQTPVDQRT